MVLATFSLKKQQMNKVGRGDGEEFQNVLSCAQWETLQSLWPSFADQVGWVTAGGNVSLKHQPDPRNQAQAPHWLRSGKWKGATERTPVPYSVQRTPGGWSLAWNTTTGWPMAQKKSSSPLRGLGGLQCATNQWPMPPLPSAYCWWKGQWEIKQATKAKLGGETKEGRGAWPL